MFMEALQVIVNIPPIKLIAEDRKSIYNAKNNNIDPRAVGNAAKNKLVDKWQESWQAAKNGGSTRKLIKNIAPRVSRWFVQINYYLTQALSGYGCFPAYLCRFKKTDSSRC